MNKPSPPPKSSADEKINTINNKENIINNDDNVNNINDNVYKNENSINNNDENINNKEKIIILITIKILIKIIIISKKLKHA